jgi:beta-lactamase superfamily II metal-dependent hydrolase
MGKVIFGNTKILFTGDADSIIEDQILAKYNLDADILKVGHHGSKNSTSPQFLAEVTPLFAVISVGENNYGHPTMEVLQNLQTAQAKVFRTDLDQTVQFTSNGVELVHE